MKSQGIALIVAGLLAGCGSNTGDLSTDTATAAHSRQSARADRTMASVKGSVAADYQQVVQQLYIAYFGRPADPGGLANFQSALLAAGAHSDVPGLNADYSTNAAVKTLVDSFGASAESIALYGNSSTTSFISAIYQNVLGRTPPANDEGLAFWAGEVTSGRLSRGNAALSIAAGAMSNQSDQGKLDAQLITNRLTVASSFTTQLTSRGTASSYAGDTAAASARAMLAQVTATTNTTTFTQSTAMAATWAQVVVPGLFHGTTSMSQNKRSDGAPIHHGGAGGSFSAFTAPDGATWMLYGGSTLPDGLDVYGSLTGGGALIVRAIAVGSHAAYSANAYYGNFTQFAAPGNVPVAAQSNGLGYELNGMGSVNGYLGSLPPFGTSLSAYPLNTYPTYTAKTAGTLSYNFNTPATVASIANTWSGGLLDGGTASISIAASGAISGTTSLGCTLTGTASASTSAKNFFTVSITYGAAPCTAAGQTQTGIAYVYALSDGSTTATYTSAGTTVTYAPLNGKSQLIIATMNASKTHATAFYAQR